MIKKYIIEAVDSLQGFDKAIEKLEREWGAEEVESSADCISREDAIKVVHEYFQHYLKVNDDICLDGIRSLPSVLPQPKIGKWIDIDETHSKCDKCGAIFEIVSANGEANFCPNCGADMRESDKK